MTHSTPGDRARIAAAEAAQARMLAALPDFPQFGFYVKTGLAGYGPDLDENDYPARSWEDVAHQVAEELSFMADFNAEGASALADQAREAHDEAREVFRLYASVADYQGIADTYRDADDARRLADELGTLAANFSNLAKELNPAPLYQGRPELRHARIWDLISQLPVYVSDNLKLYVWECEEDPGDPDDAEPGGGYGPAGAGHTDEHDIARMEGDGAGLYCAGA
jgi:hypothetical protein